MRDWIEDLFPTAFVIGGIALVIGLLVLVERNESAYKAQLLARAHTYADTLAVEQIMAQRATANAIGFAGGVIAGSNAARRR